MAEHIPIGHWEDWDGQAEHNNRVAIEKDKDFRDKYLQLLKDSRERGERNWDLGEQFNCF